MSSANVDLVFLCADGTHALQLNDNSTTWRKIGNSEVAHNSTLFPCYSTSSITLKECEKVFGTKPLVSVMCRALLLYSTGVDASFPLSSIGYIHNSMKDEEKDASDKIKSMLFEQYVVRYKMIFRGDVEMKHTT